MGLFHVAYNGYVWKALFLYRHPDRSGGIFLAHWYSVLCETAENGKPLAKGVRNDGVQGRFLDCTRNDGMGGMGLFHVAYNGYVWKVLFPYRHPERSRGIFLAHWYSVLCEIAEKGKPLAKGARNDGVQERFLAALEMTVWCISPYARQRKMGIHLRKEQERAECKEDFLTALKMTVGKAADSMNLKFQIRNRI